MADILSYQKRVKSGSGSTSGGNTKSEKGTSTKKSKIAYVDYTSIQFTADQRVAFDTMCGDGNVLITGPAGTGKSTLLKSFYCWYIDTHCGGKMEDESIYITSTTGISAMNISGITIHSWSGIEDGSKTIDYYIEKLKTNMTKRSANHRWKKAKVLIIDEISMMSGEMLDKLCILGQRLRGSAEPFGGIKVVAFCDFLQLPPVKSDIFAFDAICWRKLAFKVCFLNEIMRQKDATFQGILNKIRVGLVDDEVEAYLTHIFKNGRTSRKDGIIPTLIFPLRKQVQDYNQQELNKISSTGTGTDSEKLIVYRASYTFSKNVEEYEKERYIHIINEGTNCEETLQLAVGAQVMYLVNQNELNLVNGSRGVIVDFITRMNEDTRQEEQIPVVKFLNIEKPIPVEYETWTHEDKSGKCVVKRQIPLMLAWALTVHKTQGCTLDYVELNIGAHVFEAGQTYVALSRVKDPSGLFISALDLTRIKAHPKCVQFYNLLEKKVAGSRQPS